jgi:hypothetical protein
MINGSYGKMSVEEYKLWNETKTIALEDLQFNNV